MQLLAIFFFLIPVITHAADEKYTVHIFKTTETIIVDGQLNERIWQSGTEVDSFFQSVPFDTSFARTKTQVNITYDDKNIYIAARCYDDHPDKPYIIQSLKRDYSYPVTDGFGVYFDPFNDQSNGFAFTCNPYGVQREGLLANSGLFGVSTDWDCKWLVETSSDSLGWYAEMAIPFKSLRYNEGVTTWRINFSRNNLKLNEGSSWVPVPRNFNIGSLLNTGLLVWDAAPKKPGLNMSIIPYAIAQRSIDYMSDDKIDDKLNAGADIKLAVTSSLNLDVTVNPDFSQVEVDRQQTNLSRFSLFYPEKRTFFIENSDLFANIGFSKIRPFFSRTIGLYNGQTVPILAGARLSGKLNQKIRIGLMDLQTESVSDINLASYNYGVLAGQYQVGAKSNVSIIGINKQGFNRNKIDKNDYYRLIGSDYAFNSRNNLLTGRIFYHRQFDTSSVTDKSAHAVFLLFKKTKYSLEYNHEYVGQYYNPAVGYLGYDNGYFRTEDHANYYFYPKKSKLNSHGPELLVSQYWNSGFKNQKPNSFYIGRPLDGEYIARYIFKWLNTANLSLGFKSSYTYLRRPFDPSGNFSVTLPQNTSYSYNTAAVTFTSDFRKKFSYVLSAEHGEYFNGTRSVFSADATWRLQPIAIIGLGVARNDIRLPSPYLNGYITLAGARFEFAFTRSFFFTTFLQYNTQIENMNVNARLQWRFKPLSDFYIVYTDNYYTPDLPLSETSQDFKIKNRAIVFKLNYWFSL